MSPKHLELVEPTFVLRASDPASPALLRQWARRHEQLMKRGVVTPGVELGDVERARQLALDMDRWAQQDAVRRYHEVLSSFSKRFPNGRSSAQVVKLRRPE